jgi:hypothetical protein
MKILDFFLFLLVVFALLDPDPDPQFECGSMRIRIRNPARKKRYLAAFVCVPSVFGEKFPTAEFGMIWAATSCWEIERK